MVSKWSLKINPMEMYGLYDQLWGMGTLLQGRNALDVLDDGYRPWARVHPEDVACQEWYVRNEARKPATMEKLHAFRIIDATIILLQALDCICLKHPLQVLDFPPANVRV